MIFIAALAFAVALILDFAGVAKGHFDPTTFMLAGLLFLALAGCPWGWVNRRQ